MAAPLLHALDSLTDQTKDALWALAACVCQQSAKVKINGRTFKIVKVLGEGGFSFVYLAQDEASGRQFALKKIRCPTGADAVAEALREAEAYRRFRHPNIIRILDSAVEQDRDGEGKIVYLFLPLYKRGNLQDAINRNLVHGRHFPEAEMVRLFRGTCEAVRAMHAYRAPARAAGPPAEAARADEHEHEEDEALPHPEGDAEGGYSYDGASVPLIARRPAGEVVFDGDAEEAAAQGDGAAGEPVPYAHRDIKPGNVMLADDGATPVLMDFGSAVRARVRVATRAQALAEQDLAAERSTMPYRAPELFDVKTGSVLDEKVDIWSLGCTLYALAYAHSPFETAQTTEQGGSLAMSVLNGAYRHPAHAAAIYSAGLRGLIDRMLTVDPAQRPDIHEVLAMTDAVLQNLA